MEVLRTENLKKIYQTPSGEVRALDGVSVSIEEGEFVAVIGSSGSGKTTLLNMLGGLDTPTEGDVIVRGKRLGGMKGEELTVFRRRNVGFVFQNYNLMPILSVKENITLPLKLDGMGLDRDFLNRIVDSLGLRKKLNDLPEMLSGGQQQRVAIARALSTKPAVILADEPTGNLDSHSTQDIMSVLKDLHKSGRTVILITHDNDIAAQVKRVIRIKDGRVEADYMNEGETEGYEKVLEKS